MKKSVKWLAAMAMTILLLTAGPIFGTGTEETSATPAVEDEAFAPVEISFWHALSGANGKALLALVDRFNLESDNVTVAAEYAGGYADALNKLVLSVQSGEAPNIMQTYDIGTQTMMDSGAVIALQDLQDEFPSIQLDLADFVQAALNYYTFEGKVHALPFAQSSPILYYNKDRFKEVGLDPESPPVTYAEFLDAAEKLTDPDAEVATYGASWAIRSWLVEQQVALQKSDIFNNGNGRDARATEIFINDKPTENFISMWATMAANGHYLNPGRSWAEARNNFVAGISSMMLQSTAGIARTISGVGENFELGTGLLPRPDGAKGGIIVSGNALWAMDGHSRAENHGTLEFFAWLAQPSQQIEWHNATGYYPLRNATIDELTASGYYDENPHHYTAIRQLLASPANSATAGGTAGPYPEIRGLVESAIESVLAEDSEVDKTLDQLAVDVEQLLSRYNRLYGN
jgi:sn-glycerol 3-phosphate transport system substrate-binding protein